MFRWKLDQSCHEYCSPNCDSAKNVHSELSGRTLIYLFIAFVRTRIYFSQIYFLYVKKRAGHFCLIILAIMLSSRFQFILFKTRWERMYILQIKSVAIVVRFIFCCFLSHAQKLPLYIRRSKPSIERWRRLRYYLVNIGASCSSSMGWSVRLTGWSRGNRTGFLSARAISGKHVSALQSTFSIFALTLAALILQYL